MALTAPPALVADDHELDGFDCGEPSLNEWLTLFVTLRDIRGGIG